jgi:hypothetical protein
MNSMTCPAYAPNLTTTRDRAVSDISYVSQLKSGMASVSSGTVHITSPLSSRQNNVLGIILHDTLKHFTLTYGTQTTQIYISDYYIGGLDPYSPLYSSLFCITRLRNATHNLKEKINNSDCNPIF